MNARMSDGMQAAEHGREGISAQRPAWHRPRRKMTAKLGFNQPKLLTSIQVTDDYPGSHREDRRDNWLAGL